MSENNLRLFIAINLPNEIKTETEILKNRIDDKLRNKPLGFRWLPPENWHFTLVFLGDKKQESVPLIQKAMAETAVGFEKIKIEFEKIVYGPVPHSARMIWIKTSPETNQTLIRLKKNLEEKLSAEKVIFGKDDRPFNAHLTLAKFLKTGLQPFEEKFHAGFEAKNLDLMKSTLKRIGAEYEKIFQIAFQPTLCLNE